MFEKDSMAAFQISVISIIDAYRCVIDLDMPITMVGDHQHK